MEKQIENAVTGKECSFSSLRFFLALLIFT